MKQKTTRIKEFMAVALLPLPVASYLLGRFILKVPAPEYLALASGLILIAIILLLKTDVVVADGTGKTKIHVSLVKKKKPLKKEVKEAISKKKVKAIPKKKIKEAEKIKKAVPLDPEIKRKLAILESERKFTSNVIKSLERKKVLFEKHQANTRDMDVHLEEKLEDLHKIDAQIHSLLSKIGK